MLQFYTVSSGAPMQDYGAPMEVRLCAPRTWVFPPPPNAHISFIRLYTPGPGV